MQPVRLSIFARSDMGRVRANNEDSFVVSDLETGTALANPAETEVRERGVLLVVSDGMGGHAAGEVASKLVVDSLHTSLSDPDADRSSMQQIINTAVHKANAEVWQAAHDASKEGMGATLTAVLIHEQDAYVAEVGDSRAYLLRAGNIRQITKDQSFVQMLLDAGALKPEEAKDSPQKNVILQGMGLQPKVHVAIGRLSLRRGDRLLLCSDGLSNKVHEEELRELLAELDLRTACSHLFAIANERGGEDNITAVLAEVSGEALPEPRAEEPVAHALEVLQEFGIDDTGTPESAEDPAPDSARPGQAPATAPGQDAATAPWQDAATAPVPAPTAPAAEEKAGGVPMGIVLAISAVVLAAAVLWFLNR